jgi:hypothetical protein
MKRTTASLLFTCKWFSIAMLPLCGWLSFIQPLPAQTTQPVLAAVGIKTTVGERVPSEDSVINDLHSLGLVRGQIDIFRSACPVRDLARRMTTTQPTAAERVQAKARMQHLYDLGIRTVISFEVPQGDVEEKTPGKGSRLSSVTLEEAAAGDVGIKFVSRPMSNAGPNSMENLSDDAVFKWADAAATEILEDAKTGGVDFHCSAGHDRTGVVCAFIRMKYQHWPVDQAIDEMRRYGHNWPKYSRDGGISSWHEAHLRAIAKMLLQDAAP